MAGIRSLRLRYPNLRARCRLCGLNRRRPPMPSPESVKLLDMLRGQPRPASAPSWEESRKAMESFARPADADVVCTPVDAGGVPAEWITGPGTADGPVVLYLHGGGYTSGSIVTPRQL